jgi:hypothetical protein
MLLRYAAFVLVSKVETIYLKYSRGFDGMVHDKSSEIVKLPVLSVMEAFVELHGHPLRI